MKDGSVALYRDDQSSGKIWWARNGTIVMMRIFHVFKTSWNKNEESKKGTLMKTIHTRCSGGEKVCE